MNGESGSAKEYQTEKRPDFVKVENSTQFKRLIREKKKFTIPITIFFMVFYFLLPILTSYTTFLNTPAIGDISWVWLFAFAQFIMTFTLSIVYVKKASGFDKQAEQIIADQLEKGEDDA
ncbi:uncharacterized membrane protein (DUF485 family) [Virgibacillus natechei]|uniref:Uncharacterized membrane protein (DUF485 family) n=1 Tax=Virgibacillus natechei TaxID=1216297 RepID=A0ABS4IHX4_9BACI|nr:DUF485 domain-containing protein [Virgibacillus natechei]MBP1970558.1 uncharacterized membrane protein (DUF485 family) [Virgibacillus natechei]UZD14042.1 DUF485 domain-containing protein [Virgibacillus natechei]